jgi:hypothetical protein
MYALVHRLTRSAAAAFLAGLAFAFAPVRVSQLPHIQMLPIFYSPLVLLGLHAWLESRRHRWLVLAGTCWLLQGAVSGYRRRVSRERRVGASCPGGRTPGERESTAPRPETVRRRAPRNGCGDDAGAVGPRCGGP